MFQAFFVSCIFLGPVSPCLFILLSSSFSFSSRVSFLLSFLPLQPQCPWGSSDFAGEPSHAHPISSFFKCLSQHTEYTHADAHVSLKARQRCQAEPAFTSIFLLFSMNNLACVILQALMQILTKLHQRTLRSVSVTFSTVSAHTQFRQADTWEERKVTSHLFSSPS